MISTGSIDVRDYKESVDKPFIYSTWLKNYKHSSYFAKRVKSVVFYSGHHAILDHLLKKPQIRVLIASPKNDPDTILGYLVCETEKNHTVHFVFVKDAFRNMGIARALFNHAMIEPNKMHFTHWTIPVDDLIRRWPDMIYDPYKL